MEKEKLIIFGATGYIGSSLVEHLKSESRMYLTAGRSKQNDIEIDLEKPDLKNINVFKTGDKCIFLAAMSSPEFCSKNYAKARLINVTNTGLIIEALLNKGVLVLFASSDVVYGRTAEAVDETSSISPQFEYAEMKVAIEEKFRGHPNFKVMRLSYVWSVNDKFTKYAIEISNKDNSIEIFHPFVRSIVTLTDVIDFLWVFIDSLKSLPPIVNLSGPDFVSRLELVAEISKYVDLQYRAVEADEDFFRYRPDQILMQSRFLSEILGRPSSNLATEIKTCFEDMKRS